MRAGSRVTTTSSTVGRVRSARPVAQRRAEPVRILDPDAVAAHRAGDRGIIHLDEVGGLVAPAEHRVLQRLDVTRGGVVDDDDRQPDAGTPRGLELAQHHVEPAVAGDRDDRRGRRRQRRPDPAGQPVADRRQTAIRDEMPPRRLRVVEQPGPVAGKPAIGDQDAVRRQCLVELAAEPRHVDRPLARNGGAAPPRRAMTPSGPGSRRHNRRAPPALASPRRRAPRRDPRARPWRRPTAPRLPAGSGRSPRRRCRDGSAGSFPAATHSAWSRSRRACSRRRRDSPRPRSARWRCANSGRRARPKADGCRRCRPCRSSYARPGSTAPRQSASSASYPAERWMPPPTRISGRLARAISAAARAMSARSGRMRRAGTLNVDGSIAKSSAVKSCSPWQTSSGTSSSTGPGRPEVATAKARRSSSGTRLVSSTRISSLTAGPQDLGLPAFLRHVLPGMRAVGVAGQRDDRDRRR